MHSVTVDADPASPTRFHYNSDLSGDVIATVPASMVEPVPGEPGMTRVRVPGRNLEGFILEITRDRMISRLEQMSAAELRAFIFHTR